MRSAVAVAVALGLLAAACGDSDEGGTTNAPNTTSNANVPPTTTGETPTKGGELRYLLPIETPSMDPCRWSFTGQGTNGQRAVAVYDSLVRLDNATATFKMHIAESLAPSADFGTWTLKIRPNVKFSDGTPFNAEAVKFNWERLADRSLNCAMAGQVANIASMTVSPTDPQTLEIKLKSPSATFIDIVSARIGSVIASPTALKSLGNDFGIKPVGAGPFLMESWVKDDKMVLVRNPTYWQADKGLPYLDKITVRPLGDENQRVTSLQNGEADLMTTQIGPNIQQLEKAGLPVVKLLFQGAEPAILNTAKAPFNDIRARKALAMSIDNKALVDVTLNGSIPVADGFFYPESPFDDPSVKWPAYDCNGAGALWAAIAKDTGGPVKFTLGGYNNGQTPSMEFIQASVKKCGGSNVDVAVDMAAPAVAQPRVLAKDYQAHGWGIQFISRPEAILLQLTCGNPGNTTGFCNKAMDDAIAKANITSDKATLKTLYSQIETILANELPAVFYKRSLYTAGFGKNVRGVTLYEDGILPVESIWIKK
jgi:peptide/nickel transport system substrate-binding protein